MTPFPVILAHGALGIWDEVIFICVGLGFLGMMGVSWMRSRELDLDDSAPAGEDAAPAAVDAPDSEDHFPLQ